MATGTRHVVAELAGETRPGATPIRAMQALGFSRAADEEGWFRREINPVGRFDDIFEDIAVRAETGGTARLRFVPQARHLNFNGVIHGSFLLCLIDHALFAGPVLLGVDRVVGGSTVETTTQFCAPIQNDIPLDLVVEVMRETGRMVFLRGTIAQNGAVAVAFTGLISRARDSERGIEEFIAVREAAKAVRMSLPEQVQPVRNAAQTTD